MPFSPTHIPERYVQSPYPALGNERTHLERELREISKAILSLTEAVREIQEHLDTL